MIRLAVMFLAALAAIAQDAGHTYTVIPKADDSVVGELRFKEKYANGSSHVGFKAPAALAGTVVWQLPGVDGSSGKCWGYTGAGTIGWVDCSAGSGVSLPVEDTTAIAYGSADATKQIRFEVDGLTTATTRVITVPDADFTLPGLSIAQTWTANQTYAANLLPSGTRDLGASSAGSRWNNIFFDTGLYVGATMIVDSSRNLGNINNITAIGTIQGGNLFAASGALGYTTSLYRTSSTYTLVGSTDIARFSALTIADNWADRVTVVDSSRNGFLTSVTFPAATGEKLLLYDGGSGYKFGVDIQASTMRLYRAYSTDSMQFGYWSAGSLFNKGLELKDSYVYLNNLQLANDASYGTMVFKGNVDPQSSNTYDLGGVAPWKTISFGTSLYFGSPTLGGLELIDSLRNLKNIATATVTGFKMATGAGVGKYLVSDASGNGTWSAITGYVPTSRTINTTSPLGGGGALSADLTLTCATCVTTDTAQSISGLKTITEEVRLKDATEARTWSMIAVNDSGTTPGWPYYSYWKLRDNEAGTDAVIIYTKALGASFPAAVWNVNHLPATTDTGMIGSTSSRWLSAAFGSLDLTSGFKLATGAGAGKILTSDASGNGTWQSGALPAGTANYTLRYDGGTSTWASSGALQNSGSTISIYDVGIQQYRFGTGGNWASFHANGTSGSPTATAANDLMGVMSGRGYYVTGGPGYSGVGNALVRFYAAENFTSTAHGAYMTFATTPIGSTTNAERARITDDGNLLVGTTDNDGTPATGRLVAQGSTSDGTTNILVGRDSSAVNVFTVNTDGVTTTNHVIESRGGLGIRNGYEVSDLKDAREIGFYAVGNSTLSKPSGASAYGAVITNNYISNTRGQLFMNTAPGTVPYMWARASSTWSDDDQWQAWVRVLVEDYSGDISVTRNITAAGQVVSNVAAQPAFVLQQSSVTRGSLWYDNAADVINIGRYSDIGVYVDSPVSIARATGVVTLAGFKMTSGAAAGKVLTSDAAGVGTWAAAAAPANMVTTDTAQTITGTKTFTSSVLVKDATSANYWTMAALSNTCGTTGCNSFWSLDDTSNAIQPLKVWTKVNGAVGVNIAQWTAHQTPTTTGTYDIGNATYRWNNIVAKSLNLDTGFKLSPSAAVGRVLTSDADGNGTWSAITGYVPTSRTISTSSPLSGGGDLTANRTLSCPTCVTTDTIQTISGAKTLSSNLTLTANIMPSGAVRDLGADATRWNLYGSAVDSNTILANNAFAVGVSPTTTHPIYAYKSENASWTLRLENYTTGTAAGVGVFMMTDNNSYSGAVSYHSSSHSSYPSYLRIVQGRNAPIQFETNGTARIRIDGSGHLIPVSDSSYNLGSSSAYWANGYIDTVYVSAYLGGTFSMSGSETITGNLYQRTFSGTPTCSGVADGWTGVDTSGSRLYICIGGAAKYATLN